MKKFLMLAVLAGALVYFSPMAKAYSGSSPEKIHHKHHKHHKHHHHLSAA